MLGWLGFGIVGYMKGTAAVFVLSFLKTSTRRHPAHPDRVYALILNHTMYQVYRSVYGRWMKLINDCLELRVLLV